ncbi:MAG: siderophore ferric iron reductase [Vibrio sp.]
MVDPRYQALFSQAKGVTAYLDGYICASPHSKAKAPRCQSELDVAYLAEPAHGDLLDPKSDNQDKLASIYQTLEQNYPEAGHAYWLSRTWSLLTWQPVYISLLSIYGLKALPELDSLTQVWRPDLNFVAGFGLNGAQFYSDCPEVLISKAASQLKPLFESYREQLDSNVRVRPAFVNHLLADGLVASLLRFQQHLPLDANQLAKHAKLWLQAFGLPEKSLEKLHFNSQTQLWEYTRTSCCMAYRCASGSLCQDCPRKKT